MKWHGAAPREQGLRCPQCENPERFVEILDDVRVTRHWQRRKGEPWRLVQEEVSEPREAYLVCEECGYLLGPEEYRRFKAEKGPT